MPDFKLLFILQVDCIPSSEQSVAETMLRECLETHEGKQEISNHLSSELKTDINVVKIEPGSIKIHVTLKDVKCAEKIRYLSNTGYWSLSFHYILDKLGFLEKCSISSVNVKLDEESYQRLIQQAKGNIFLYSEVVTSATIS